MQERSKTASTNAMQVGSAQAKVAELQARASADDGDDDGGVKNALLSTQHGTEKSTEDQLRVWVVVATENIMAVECSSKRESGTVLLLS